MIGEPWFFAILIIVNGFNIVGAAKDRNFSATLGWFASFCFIIVAYLNENSCGGVS